MATPAGGRASGALDPFLRFVAALLVLACIYWAQAVLIPVAMDMLSLQGAAACIETSKMLTELFKVEIKAVGLLPTMIDEQRRGSWLSQRSTLQSFIARASSAAK